MTGSTATDGASPRAPDPAPLHYSGTGPGAQTRDGCSVELYRRATYRGEIDHLRPFLPPGTTVMELGCGTGLLTHRLLEFGCAVTGVDNSADMLAHVSDSVRRIHADIETLALDQRFDVVLLSSGLINHADAAVRSAFIAAAARHVSSTGRVILKRQDPAWLRAAQVGQRGGDGDLSIEVVSVARTPDPMGEQVRMTLRYEQGDEVWIHAFTVVTMDEPAIASLLAREGFAAAEALDDARLWLSAGLRANASD